MSTANNYTTPSGVALKVRRVANTHYSVKCDGKALGTVIKIGRQWWACPPRAAKQGSGFTRNDAINKLVAWHRLKAVPTIDEAMNALCRPTPLQLVNHFATRIGELTQV